ncbi:MAG: SdrD B-like domain-containing protein [Nitrosopumilaceae archaeon]
MFVLLFVAFSPNLINSSFAQTSTPIPGTIDKNNISKNLSHTAIENELLPVLPDPNSPVTFFGHGGYSADALGQNGGGGTIQAQIPPGSTVRQAYLYASTICGGAVPSLDVNFDGTIYTLNPIPYGDVNCLQSYKYTGVDLKNQVAAKYASAGPGIINFVIGNDPPTMDGVILVVIYSNPSIDETSILLSDGGLPQGGATTVFGLGLPLDKTDPGFNATLALGIGYSYQGVNGHQCGGGQFSTVDINGQRLTSCAGNYDDGVGNNGGLITMGGVGDSINNPADVPTQDDELYNLAPYLNNGDTQIVMNTNNPSFDDLIFVSIVQLTDAKITQLNALGSISGIKINETDADGILDINENTVAGVQICLDRTSPFGFVIQNMGCIPTNQTGDYYFSNLFSGFYKVREITPPNTVQTFPHNNKPHYLLLAPSQNLTGVNFGNTPSIPGSISGIKFNDTNGDGIWNSTTEDGIPNVIITLRDLNRTLTDENGNYSFTNLPPGNYTVSETLPQGTISTTPLFQQIQLGPGDNVVNVNFGNTPIVPPPPEVQIKNQTWTYNNLPVVYWGTGQTFTKDVIDHCGSDQPVAVELYLTFSESGHVRHGPMIHTGPGEVWSATFLPFVNPGNGSAFTDHGQVSLKFLVDCPPATIGFPPADPTDLGALDGEDEVQFGGMIYVDPSGHIVDVNGNPIEGATVTLLVESPPDTGNFILPNSTEILPTTNPQITGPDGMYGWVVSPGNWKVNATKIGFMTNSSAVLSIPPAVTNLNITLSAQTYCGKSVDQFDSVIPGSTGSDVLVGTSGNDLMVGNGGNDNIFGRAGDDCIISADGRDYISGGAGNDTISSGAGKDKIWGGAGNDTISAGDGIDKIIGGPGNDILNGDTGDDIIWGQAGDDTIDGGDGSDVCVDFGGTNTATNCEVYYHS